MPLKDEAVFEAMVRTMFTQRRKTLLNALRPFAEEHGSIRREAIADGRHRRRPPTRDAATRRVSAACGRFSLLASIRLCYSLRGFSRP